jgi:cytosine/adenosine deaminase-related metal-dependent hydrolase
VSSFAICNAAIFTVDPHDRVIKDGTLVVQDGMITQVGDDRAVTVPDGFEVIDGRGHAVQSGTTCVMDMFRYMDRRSPAARPGVARGLPQPFLYPNRNGDA